MKRIPKGLAAALVAVASIASGPSLPAARVSSASASSSETASSVSGLRPSDPHKELRHLSKDLRLTREQRTAVGSILQERSREIRLLLDVEPLSLDNRNTLATKVMQDTNVQIETLLGRKQKRRFDKQLVKDRIER
jgi:hypothetical protein